MATTKTTRQITTKAELTKLLESYELSPIDSKVIETWSHKTWAPQALRDAAREYVGSGKQTPSLLLWAVYVLDTHGMFRDISRKGRQDFLKDFD